MYQILVVAGDSELRQRLAAAVEGTDRPVITTSSRTEAAGMLDGVRQVMIYAAEYGGHVGWVAEALEAHPGLRVIYISPSPWVSLSYQRARCMIAPVYLGLLDVNLLRRMVAELLSIGAEVQAAGSAPAHTAGLPQKA